MLTLRSPWFIGSSASLLATLTWFACHFFLWLISPKVVDLRLFYRAYGNELKMAEVAVEAWYALTFHHPPPQSP